LSLALILLKFKSITVSIIIRFRYNYNICFIVLDHTDWEDIGALEIFAKSLLADKKFKSASKYCQLAIKCCKVSFDLDKKLTF
jgi:hypothetical protein